MKVIVANWVYNWGSTGYILRDICSGLEQKNIEALPACSTTLGMPKDNAFVFAGKCRILFFHYLIRLGWPVFQGSWISTILFINFIKKEKPDVVNLHLLHCASLNLYYLLKWLGKHNIKTVITHHAELYYTGSCGHSYSCMQFVNNQCLNCDNIKYATGAVIGGNPHKNWLRMKKAFGYFKKENLLFTSVSPWVKSRLALSPICNHVECDVVMNGVETSIFYRRDVPQGNYILFVSANFNPSDKNDVKGGWYLVELAKLMPEQQFLVVATESSNCDNLPENLKLHGKAKDQNELAELYSAAALTVLTSRRETFSMICAESLCCGTPIVGFKAGGPESIAIKDYSNFVEQGDVDSLRDAVLCYLQKEFDCAEIAKRAQVIYSKEAMVNGYLKAYYKVLGK